MDKGANLSDNSFWHAQWDKNLENFKPTSVKREDFKTNTKEIVLASVFKHSKGSFFKVLGDSELQIHIWFQIKVVVIYA